MGGPPPNDDHTKPTTPPTATHTTGGGVGPTSKAPKPRSEIVPNSPKELQTATRPKTSRRKPRHFTTRILESSPRAEAPLPRSEHDPMGLEHLESLRAKHGGYDAIARVVQRVNLGAHRDHLPQARAVEVRCGLAEHVEEVEETCNAEACALWSSPRFHGSGTRRRRRLRVACLCKPRDLEPQARGAEVAAPLG